MVLSNKTLNFAIAIAIMGFADILKIAHFAYSYCVNWTLTKLI